jgi:hypothetical protein
MSANESGPRYYYNDPTSSPYHDPSWYKGNSNDKDNDQREDLFKAYEEVFFDSSDLETLILK